MNKSRILVLCPDYDKPSGGVRRLYRHVDVLRRHGADAWLVHEKDGFRCGWFGNDTPVISRPKSAPTSSDFLVVPEIFVPGIPTLAPGVPKVIFNQNAYLTFQAIAVQGARASLPYLHPDVISVLAVSEDNADYLRFAYPGLIVRRLHYGIDSSFSPRWPKRNAVTYMPRKNALDVVQVLAMLQNRNSLKDWAFEAIDGLPESQVAHVLAGGAIFLSFGTIEGCPLPPLEAMACGCVVIGYHGRGGREYFKSEFSFPVEHGDVVGFVKTIENALDGERQSPGYLPKLGQLASEFVRTHYSPEREEWDIISLWRTIGEMTRRQVLHP